MAYGLKASSCNPLNTAYIFSLHVHKSCFLTTYNWQNEKRVFLTCPCHEIYRDEAVGLKNAIILEKCEYVEFEAISWKIDILSITAWLKFESKNSFAHVWHI